MSSSSASLLRSKVSLRHVWNKYSNETKFHFTPAQLITGASRFHSLGIHEYQNLCKMFLLKHPIACWEISVWAKTWLCHNQWKHKYKRCAGKQCRPSNPVKANTSQSSVAKLKIGLLFCWSPETWLFWKCCVFTWKFCCRPVEQRKMLSYSGSTTTVERSLSSDNSQMSTASLSGSTESFITC